MYKTRYKQVIVDKWGYQSKVSKTIAKKGIEGCLVYCDNGPIEVRSPMSRTRLRQFIDEKWGD